MWRRAAAVRQCTAALSTSAAVRGAAAADAGAAASASVPAAAAAAASPAASPAASSLVQQIQHIAAAQPSYKRLRDEHGHRFYQFDAPCAKPLPSVTSVLSVIAKPALVAWSRNTALDSMRAHLAAHHGEVLTKEHVDKAAEAAKQHPSSLFNKAADYGLRAHEAIEHVVLGTDPRPAAPKAVAGAVDSFERWWSAAGLHTACAELVVHSERYGFAGQCDAVAVRGGGRGGDDHESSVAADATDAASVAVFDWKTSSGVYPEYALQVAAYAKALEEMSGGRVHVREGWVVRIGRNGNGADFEARRVRDLDAAFLMFRAALYLFNNKNAGLFDERRPRR